MSAVLTTSDVYEAFLDRDSRERAFLHSHSYTGNPLGCAAALASLSIFESEPVLERNRATARRMGELAAPFADHPNVAEVRQTGMILAIELVADKATREPFPVAAGLTAKIVAAGLANGIWVYPGGAVEPARDTITFGPPFTITDAEIEEIGARFERALESALARVR